MRAADLKGYSYSREDVEARSLANSYAQMLGQVFTHEMKPLEVEILVAEVGLMPDDDRLFHILYDGTVMDEEGFSVLGGDAETINERLKASYRPGVSLAAVIASGVAALAGPDRTLTEHELEVAVLRRGVARRTFERIDGPALTAVLLANATIAATAAATAAPATEATADHAPDGAGDGGDAGPGIGSASADGGGSAPIAGA